MARVTLWPCRVVWVWIWIKACRMRWWFIQLRNIHARLSLLNLMSEVNLQVRWNLKWFESLVCLITGLAVRITHEYLTTVEEMRKCSIATEMQQCLLFHHDELLSSHIAAAGIFEAIYLEGDCIESQGSLAQLFCVLLADLGCNGNLISSQGVQWMHARCSLAQDLGWSIEQVHQFLEDRWMSLMTLQQKIPPKQWCQAMMPWH